MNVFTLIIYMKGRNKEMDFTSMNGINSKGVMHSKMNQNYGQKEYEAWAMDLNTGKIHMENKFKCKKGKRAIRENGREPLRRLTSPCLCVDVCTIAVNLEMQVARPHKRAKPPNPGLFFLSLHLLPSTGNFEPLKFQRLSLNPIPGLVG